MADTDDTHVDKCAGVDTDLLGLGVRLGVYLQLVAAVILVVTGGHSSLPGHGEAASLALAGMLAVLMVKFAQGDVHAAEFLCILFLTGLQSSVAALGVAAAHPFSFAAAKGSLYPFRLPCSSLWRDPTHRIGRRLITDFDPRNNWHRLEAMRLEAAAQSQRRHQRSITLQLTVLLAAAAVAVWFWECGYRDARLQRAGCGAVWTSAYFIRVSAFGWMRHVGRALSSLCAVCCAALLLPRVLAGVVPDVDPSPSALARTPQRLEVGLEVRRVSAWEECNKLMFVSGSMSALATFFFPLAVFVVGGLSFVEMGIHYNDFKADVIGVRGLTETGQLLSIVVGAALVVTSLHAPVAPCPLWERCSSSSPCIDSMHMSSKEFMELGRALRATWDNNRRDRQNRAAAGQANARGDAAV